MSSHSSIPPLAGLCTLAEAAKPGLAVAECVRRIKRFHYAFVRLHGLFTRRITAEPIYELKTAFSHHAYLCAEHASALRARVSEMREPPLGLEEVPHPALAVAFDEMLAAPTAALIRGAYCVAMKWLMEQLELYVNESHPLADAPSFRVCKFAWMELDTMYCFGVDASAAFEEDTSVWEAKLLSLLNLSLDVATESTDLTPLRTYSLAPYEYDPVPKRDERFTDLWNQGVNAESFLYSESFPPASKALMMLYKRIREIDVPEMMASILAQTSGKPWQYYRDMARQIWDEARHAMMGEVGFTALGVDWTKCRITHNWSHRLNTECTPLERHAVLFFIEQGLMPKTGKRYEFEVAHQSGIPLMGTIQDFDWADEVLHSQIGRQWLVPEFGDLKSALEFGDKAWAKITSNWATVRDQGLTAHANWWPEVYRDACTAAGTVPDQHVLVFCETYEAKRADIHTVRTAG
jgi:hypothetical protein